MSRLITNGLKAMPLVSLMAFSLGVLVGVWLATPARPDYVDHRGFNCSYNATARDYLCIPVRHM